MWIVYCCMWCCVFCVCAGTYLSKFNNGIAPLGRRFAASVVAKLTLAQLWDLPYHCPDGARRTTLRSLALALDIDSTTRRDCIKGLAMYSLLRHGASPSPISPCNECGHGDRPMSVATASRELLAIPPDLLTYIPCCRSSRTAYLRFTLSELARPLGLLSSTYVGTMHRVLDYVDTQGHHT